MKISNSFLLLAFVLVMVACKDDNPASPVIDPEKTGTVTGYVFSANGSAKIQGALVEVENLANSPKTYTDINGYFSLSGVPEGQSKLLVTKGLFKSSISVNVVAKQEVQAADIKLSNTGQLGYFEGSFDHMQTIISGLGYPIQELETSIFEDLSKLKEYKALFFNCGCYVYFETETSINNLKKYIEDGGSAYFSDYACDYLAYLFPDKFEFVKSGNEQTVSGKIVDNDLKNFVGKENVEIIYDLGAWAIISKLPSQAKVLVRGDIVNYSGTETNAPLAFIYNYGSGKIIYTTFHNEANVTTDVLKILTGFLYSL